MIDTQQAETAESKPVGVALIGAGMIAERHVSALSAAQDSLQLKAIVSRHPERAHHLANCYAGPPPLFTSDLYKVTNDPAIQMAIVATPPSVRIDLIKKLAVAGKHILVEKPLARNLDEAQQLVKISEDASVLLGVLFQHRMRASSLTAKRILQNGSLGNTGHIVISVPLWRAQSYYDELGRGSYARDGGGVLITQAIHTVDLALSLSGPVSRVQAMTATTALHTMEAEDFAVVGLQFASGAVGSLLASTATFPHGRESITWHCQHGSMHLEAESLTVSWRDGRIEKHPAEVPSENQGRVTPKCEWHQNLIEDFHNAIQQNRAPLVTGREALATHRLIEAIEQSSDQGLAVDLSPHS